MRYFYFSSNLNFEDNLLRYKDKSIIIYNNKDSINEKELINLRKFCKNKNIKFYIINDLKFAFRHKADGLIITSDNKKPIYNFNKRIVKIGIVHTQKEYYEKKQHLISLNWNIKILALGGINKENLKKIRLTKSIGIGAITFFDKKKGPLQIL